MDSDFNLDISKLPKELILLLKLMETNSNYDLFTPPTFYSQNEWDQFIDLSKHHRIFPVIYTKIKEANVSWIPQSVLDKLHRDYMKNTFRMLELSGEMEKTCKLFSEYNIRTLLLKGPVLATALYGDLSLRTSSDIDLLIHLDDLERVEHLLKENGYVKDDYIDTVLNDWKWRHHHVTYFHSIKGIKIEVHWRLNPGPAKEPSFEELWERKQRSSLSRFPIFILGNEDLFFFLVTHGARHGWSRLRWLLDINQLVGQKLDWDKIIASLNKYHYLHLGGKTLLLTSQLFGTPINEKMLPFIGGKSRRLASATLFYLEEKINLHSEPIPTHVALYHKHYLFSLMSVYHKCLFLLSALYPYPVDERTLPLPKQLHFLYFPLRPILCVWRKLRGMQQPKGILK